MRIFKARLAFANLKHLRRRKDVSLAVKSRVYNASNSPISLYGCETWSIRASDAKQPEVFNHRCLRSLAHIGWSERVSNEYVRKLVFSNGDNHPFAAPLKQQRFPWLGHMLRMPHQILFALPEREWRKKAGGQTMTWQREMKTTGRGLVRAGACRLAGWGLQNPPLLWLHTLEDMARNRRQWRECCHFLTSLFFFLVFHPLSAFLSFYVLN
jgi:hypothetical protein